MLNALAKKINRHQWISEAAYFLAEARSFVPGKELDDWLEAKIVYSEMLITAFIAMLEEDRAAITISGLKQLASLIDIENTDAYVSNVKLIQAIQNATKHRPCFRSKADKLCEEMECQWKKECQKLIAVKSRPRWSLKQPSEPPAPDSLEATREKQRPGGCSLHSQQ